VGLFERVGRRLRESPVEIHAEHTKQLCSEVADVKRIADCAPRTHCRVAGVVESIKLIPRPFGHSLEVQIYDGTGRLVGTWLGQRTIKGIDLGGLLVLEGTATDLGNDTLTIINPAYELMPPG
jgi:hypothetical protein